MVFKNGVLSFGSFLVFMLIAGFSIAIISTFFHVALSIFKAIAGDPGLTISVFFKPFLSIVIDPIDAVISGVLIYPIYKSVVKKYFRIGIKLSVYRERE